MYNRGILFVYRNILLMSCNFKKPSVLLSDSDAGRDCGQEEKGTTEDEMAGWHHGLDGRESE